MSEPYAGVIYNYGTVRINENAGATNATLAFHYTIERAGSNHWISRLASDLAFRKRAGDILGSILAERGTRIGNNV